MDERTFRTIFGNTPKRSKIDSAVESAVAEEVDSRIDWTDIQERKVGANALAKWNKYQKVDYLESKGKDTSEFQ